MVYELGLGLTRNIHRGNVVSVIKLRDSFFQKKYVRDEHSDSFWISNFEAFVLYNQFVQMDRSSSFSSLPNYRNQTILK